MPEQSRSAQIDTGIMNLEMMAVSRELRKWSHRQPAGISLRARTIAINLATYANRPDEPGFRLMIVRCVHDLELTIQQRARDHDVGFRDH